MLAGVCKDCINFDLSFSSLVSINKKLQTSPSSPTCLLVSRCFQAACKMYMYMWKEIWMITVAVTVIESSKQDLV